MYLASNKIEDSFKDKGDALIGVVNHCHNGYTVIFGLLISLMEMLAEMFLDLSDDVEESFVLFIDVVC